MKITKYPQSTLLIEFQKTRIIIDPGSFALEKFTVDDFGTIDGVLITHQHFDHLNKESVLNWHSKGVPIFGNFDVWEVLAKEGVKINKIEDKKDLEIGNFKIRPIDLPHCKMIDGSDGPPNTGFLINNHFFHPGDGIEINDLKVDSAGIPITGPTINYDRAWNLALTLEAKKIIPMHYSNPKFFADPKDFAKNNKSKIEVIILDDGESADIISS